jgi:hypothetical protein
VCLVWWNVNNFRTGKYYDKTHVQQATCQADELLRCTPSTIWINPSFWKTTVGLKVQDQHFSDQNSLSCCFLTLNRRFFLSFLWSLNEQRTFQKNWTEKASTWLWSEIIIFREYTCVCISLRGKVWNYFVVVERDAYFSSSIAETASYRWRVCCDAVAVGGEVEILREGLETCAAVVGGRWRWWAAWTMQTREQEWKHQWNRSGNGMWKRAKLLLATEEENVSVLVCKRLRVCCDGKIVFHHAPLCVLDKHSTCCFFGARRLRGGMSMSCSTRASCSDCITGDSDCESYSRAYIWNGKSTAPCCRNARVMVWTEGLGAGTRLLTIVVKAALQSWHAVSHCEMFSVADDRRGNLYGTP